MTKSHGRGQNREPTLAELVVLTIGLLLPAVYAATASLHLGVGYAAVVLALVGYGIWSGRVEGRDRRGI